MGGWLVSGSGKGLTVAKLDGLERLRKFGYAR